MNFCFNFSQNVLVFFLLPIKINPAYSYFISQVKDDYFRALAAATLKVKECEDLCALKDRQLQQLQNLCRTLKSQIPNNQ